MSASAAEISPPNEPPAVSPPSGNGERAIALGQGVVKERRTALVLFLLTIATTAASGLLLSRDYGNLASARTLMGFDFSEQLPHAAQVWSILLQTWSFPLALLTILLCHEMGHYIQAKRFQIPASLPFFIPSLPPLGTLGAVIRMRVDKRVSARALMHMAAAGPVAGMIPAIVVLWIGVGWSRVEELPFYTDQLLFFNGGLLVSIMEHSRLGWVASGYDVVWHPVAFAGWAGCLVTALNMLPIGQLDGGHIAYALSPSTSPVVAYMAFGLLIIAGYAYIGWWIFAALIAWLIGIRHPPMIEGESAKGAARAMGIVAIVFFLLTIHPAPVSDSGVQSMWHEIVDAWHVRPMWL